MKLSRCALAFLGVACSPGGDFHGDDAASDAPNATDVATPSDASIADAASDAPAATDGATSCSSLPLCDGFENDTPGAQPSGWNVVMGCNPNMQDTAVDGGLIVGVDSSQHHTGSHSMRVVGGDTCGYYFVNTTAVPAAGAQLYVRFWAMFSPPGPTPNHNGFLSMTTSGGDHFRLGFQDDVVAWNAQKSDSTLPDMDTQGTSLSVAPSPSTWTCFEFHIDETTGYVEFWYGDATTTTQGLSYDGTSTQGVNDQWHNGSPSPPVPIDFGLGWLGLNNQETVWFDDVAIGSSRIGCN